MGVPAGWGGGWSSRPGALSAHGRRSRKGSSETSVTCAEILLAWLIGTRVDANGEVYNAPRRRRFPDNGWGVLPTDGP